MKRTTLALLVLCLAGLVLFLLQPWPFYQKLFAVAYGLDPQRPSHTYALGGVQLPLEARKTGMFGGFLVTHLLLLARGRARAASFPPRRVTLLLVAFVALMGIDGLNATLFDLGWPHLYAPGLRLRLATGLLTGLTMAALLLPALNGTLWQAISPKPSLAGVRELLLAVLVAAVLFLAVDARSGLLYCPIATLSVAGLVTELVVLNLIFILVLARRAGTAATAWDVLPVACVALLATAAELGLMSLVRYLTLGDLTSLM